MKFRMHEPTPRALHEAMLAGADVVSPRTRLGMEDTDVATLIARGSERPRQGPPRIPLFDILPNANAFPD